jgi:hypothetical protein
LFALGRRLIISLQVNSIFLTDIRKNERNGVNFELFAASLDDVLNQQALFEALQVRDCMYKIRIPNHFLKQLCRSWNLVSLLEYFVESQNCECTYFNRGKGTCPSV